MWFLLKIKSRIISRVFLLSRVPDRILFYETHHGLFEGYSPPLNKGAVFKDQIFRGERVLF